MCRFDNATSLWTAKHHGYSEFLATSSAQENTLLFGHQKWTIHNDTCLKGTYTTELLLTWCSDEKFTCSDGSCVSMSVRCDGKMDCVDGTDEADCKAFVKSLGYNKLLVPPPTVIGGKLRLNFSLNIIQIVEINEMQNYIQTKFGDTRIWFDSRLTFQNVKKNSKNLMSTSDKKSMWIPWIIFQNLASRDKILMTDNRDFARVIPNHGFNFTLGDTTKINNIHLFKGSENAIRDDKECRVEWLCDFHMEWYPFDTQSCTMQFRSNYESIDFLPVKATYSGPKELPQHYVHTINICSATIEGDQGIIVEIVLGRPIFSSFLTTTLPTVMLITISQLATSFSGEYLDMVIQVNLTVLLVLATL